MARFGQKILNYFSKPIFIQVGYFFILAAYTCAGAVMVGYLESGQGNFRLSKPKLTQDAKYCLQNIILYRHKLTPDVDTLKAIQNCFAREIRQDWTFPSSLMFTFSLITTIGYGHVYPLTAAGRVFCVFYGLLGIPLALIFLANIGKHIKQLVLHLKDKWKKHHRRRIHLSRYSIAGMDSKLQIQDINTSTVFLIGILLYGIFGAFLLPLYEKTLGFLSAFYFVFVSLTTVGFGDIYPRSKQYYLVSIVYIGLGVALNCLSIDIMSPYLKKLHHYGQKLTGVAKTSVWFGGKQTTVEELMKIFSESRGIVPPNIEELHAVAEIAVEKTENVKDDYQSESPEKVLCSESIAEESPTDSESQYKLPLDYVLPETTLPLSESFPDETSVQEPVNLTPIIETLNDDESDMETDTLLVDQSLNPSQYDQYNIPITMLENIVDYCVNNFYVE